MFYAQTDSKETRLRINCLVSGVLTACITSLDPAVQDCSGSPSCPNHITVLILKRCDVILSLRLLLADIGAVLRKDVVQDCSCCRSSQGSCAELDELAPDSSAASTAACAALCMLIVYRLRQSSF